MAWAIKKVSLLWSERGGDTSSSGSFTRQYQIVLTPTSNFIEFTEDDAFSATDGTTSIPGYNDSISVEGRLYLLGTKNVRWDDRYPGKVFVRCVYTSLPSAGGGTLPWAKDIRVETVRFVETMTRDLDGKRYVSTVGEMLDPLPERVLRGRKVTLSFLAQNFDPAPYEDLEECINQDTIVMDFQTYRGPRYRRVFAPFTILFDEINIATQFYPGATSVLSVSMSMVHKSVKEDGVEYGWKYRTANRGFHYNNGGTPAPIMVGGQVVANPQYLTSAGAIIAPGSTTKPYMLEFKNNDIVPMAALLSRI